MLVIALIFMRFDFSYSGKLISVSQGDTLFQYLNAHVFHHAGLAGASILYLRSSQVPVDMLLANVDAEGGDTIRVRSNILAVVGPNGKERVHHQILSDQALYNHLIQVIAYDLLVMACCLYIGALITDFLISKEKSIVYEQVAIVLLVVLGVPLFFLFIFGVIGWSSYFRTNRSGPPIQVPASNYLRRVELQYELKN